MELFEIGISETQDASLVEWQDLYIEAESQEKAFELAGDAGFYRNVRLRTAK